MNVVIQTIATLCLWLAPLPAAFFVGRSVYWHLIVNWHMDLGTLGIGAGVLAGITVELVGLLSAHVALAASRWNNKGQVRKEQSHWERAPTRLAIACFATYCLSAFLLAVVLEAAPAFALWAPALFTVMAAAAYLSIGVYEQHRDRLAYYGLTWDWKSVEAKAVQDTDGTVRAPVQDVQDGAPAGQDAGPESLELDRLDRAILDTLRAEPDASYRTVAETVGSAKTTVGGRVKELERQGLMARTGDGWAVHWSGNGTQEDTE